MTFVCWLRLRFFCLVWCCNGTSHCRTRRAVWCASAGPDVERNNLTFFDDLKRLWRHETACAAELRPPTLMPLRARTSREAVRADLEAKAGRIRPDAAAVEFSPGRIVVSAQLSSAQLLMKVPSRSSATACCISAGAFITIGPYQATGSAMGRPETSRKRTPCSPA